MSKQPLIALSWVLAASMMAGLKGPLPAAEADKCGECEDTIEQHICPYQEWHSHKFTSTSGGGLDFPHTSYTCGTCNQNHYACESSAPLRKAIEDGGDVLAVIEEHKNMVLRSDKGVVEVYSCDPTARVLQEVVILPASALNAAEVSQ